MKKLLKRLYQTNDLSEGEIVNVINNIDRENEKLLFDYACRAKNEHYGDAVYLRGLIEFSNICRQNCLYCGLRSGNKKLERYRLTQEEIMDCCRTGYDLGYRTFVLQSGEDSWYTVAVLKEIINNIKTMYPDVAVTLSVGERSREEYQDLYGAGADRYLLRHETYSEQLYDKLHPGMKLSSRIECLEALKDIGYQVGAGMMVGLPGQNAEDLARDLMFLKSFKPHMIGIGPFIPHGDTPFKEESGGTIEETLIVLALARLLVPDSLLPSTTAMGTLDRQGREKALKAGANVVMPNLSPVSVRAKYELYQNKINLGDEAAQSTKRIEEKIVAAGFKVDKGRGDSLRYKRHNIRRIF